MAVPSSRVSSIRSSNSSTFMAVPPGCRKTLCIVGRARAVPRCLARHFRAGLFVAGDQHLAVGVLSGAHQLPRRFGPGRPPARSRTGPRRRGPPRGKAPAAPWPVYHVRRAGPAKPGSNGPRAAERKAKASQLCSLLSSPPARHGSFPARWQMPGARRPQNRRWSPRGTAPRCPSWPLPANRSSTRAPGTRNCTLENMASLTRSMVGRVTSWPGRALSTLPRAVPAMTRMGSSFPAGGAQGAKAACFSRQSAVSSGYLPLC